MAVDLGVPGVGRGVRVGAGGFGTVFRAEQLGFGRGVAVKVLNAVVEEDVELRRFERERTALGSVADHPNIVSVFGWGLTAEKRPYLVMEFLPGGTLARLAKAGPLVPELAVSVVAKLSRALAVAHGRGVLHRDVKPENVLVSAFGEPVLCDFGIARPADGGTTHTSSVATSVSHAAPEVLEGAPASEAGDVWALVSTLHTLLAGRPPFSGGGEHESMAAVITRVLTQPPPDLRPLGVPDDVAAVVEEGLAKDPAVRLASAEVVADRLEAVMAAHGWTHQLLPVPEVELEPLPVAEAPEPEPASVVEPVVVQPSQPVADSTQVLRPVAVPPVPPLEELEDRARPSRNGPLWVLAVTGVVLVVLLAGAVGVLAGRRDKKDVAVAPPVEQTTTSSEVTTTTAATTTTLPPAPVLAVPVVPPAAVTPVTPAPVPVSSAGERLAQRTRADYAEAQAISGSWVTQLSSKKVGTQGNGQTFTLDAILDHFLGLANRYSGILLLDSDDFPSSFDKSGYWVVIVGQAHGTSQAALGFCSANRIPYDDCFAKRLGSSGPTSIAYQRR